MDEDIKVQILPLIWVVLWFEAIYIEYENYAFNQQAMLCFWQQFYVQDLEQCLAHNSA